MTNPFDMDDEEMAAFTRQINDELNRFFTDPLEMALIHDKVERVLDEKFGLRQPRIWREEEADGQLCHLVVQCDVNGDGATCLFLYCRPNSFGLFDASNPPLVEEDPNEEEDVFCAECVEAYLATVNERQEGEA